MRNKGGDQEKFPWQSSSRMPPRLQYMRSCLTSTHPNLNSKTPQSSVVGCTIVPDMKTISRPEGLGNFVGAKGFRRPWLLVCNVSFAEIPIPSMSEQPWLPWTTWQSSGATRSPTYSSPRLSAICCKSCVALALDGKMHDMSYRNWAWDVSPT